MAMGDNGRGVPSGAMAGIDAEMRAVRAVVDENRASLIRAEDRFASSIDRLVEKLDSLGSVYDKRVSTLETRYAVIASFASFAVFVMPIVTTVGVWAYGQRLSLDPDEIVVIREQIADLQEHRRLGGEGAYWISPRRRTYRDSESG